MLRIKASDEICSTDGNGVLVNSQVLPKATSSKKLNHGFVELQSARSSTISQVRASWQIGCFCLEQEIGKECESGNVAVNLKFLLHDRPQVPYQPGFTASYKQYGTPEVIRVSHFADDVAITGRDGDHWRFPSVWRPLAISESAAGDAEPEKSQDGSSMALVDAILSEPLEDATPSSSILPTAEAGSLIDTFEDVEGPLPSLQSPNLRETELGDVQDTLEMAVTLQPAQYQAQSNTINLFEHDFTTFKAKFKDLGHIVIDKFNGIHSCLKHKLFKKPLSSSITKHLELDIHQSQFDVLSSTHSQNIPLGMAPVLKQSTSSTLTISSNYDLTTTARPSFPPYSLPENSQSLEYGHKLALIILVIFAFCAGLFIHLKRNPRRRAEWAAKREECRNRRAYARAARHLRWKRWLCGLRHNHGSASKNCTPETWNEKRIVAIQQDEVSQNRVREEIYALRNAHGMVDGIIRAEEGRGRVGLEGLDRIEAYEIRSRGRRETTYSEARSDVSTLPPYDEAEVVVDGFRYTQPASDDTPDSSVIETSPRTSLHTRDSDYEKDEYILEISLKQ